MREWTKEMLREVIGIIEHLDAEQDVLGYHAAVLVELRGYFLELGQLAEFNGSVLPAEHFEDVTAVQVHYTYQAYVVIRHHVEHNQRIAVLN